MRKSRSARIVAALGIVFATTLSIAPANAINGPIAYGNPGDVPLVGRWSQTFGTTNIGVYRPSNITFYRRGYAYGVPFGNIGDKPFTGDWYGARYDTFGVLRFGGPDHGTFFFYYGSSVVSTTMSGFVVKTGDLPVIGDWGGWGNDWVGIYRSSLSAFFLKMPGRFYPVEIPYGNAGDIPIVGNWDYNTVADELGVYRPSTRTFYIRLGAGHTRMYTLGNSGDKPIVGDWNDDGKDDIGVYRPIDRTFHFLVI